MTRTHQSNRRKATARAAVFLAAVSAANAVSIVAQQPTQGGMTMSIKHAVARSTDNIEHNIELNRATARRWSEELWSLGHLEVADEIVAPDYVRHDPGDPFPARGPEDVKRIVSMLRGMLPDFRIQVDAVIAEGDIVVSRYTATATDTVGYMGQAPTGKSIRTSAMQMFRFSGGKIVESWAVRDDLGTLRQLGQVAPPAGPSRP